MQKKIRGYTINIAPKGMATYEREVFKRKLVDTWKIAGPRLHLPRRNTPLEHWIVPHKVNHMGVSVLNWVSWIRGSDSQASELEDLICSDPAFLLWKNSDPRKAIRDPACEETSQRREFIPMLQTQTIDQVLRDELAGETPRLMFESAADAAAKLFDATSVYTLREGGTGGTAGREVDAIAILSSEGVLSRSFSAPSRAMACLRKLANGLPIRFVDVFLSSSCVQHKTASRLLSHLEAVFPRSVFVVCTPPVLTTLSLYQSLGFQYRGSRGTDLLPDVLGMMRSAVALWHLGMPYLTHTDAIDPPQLCVSYISPNTTETMESIVRRTGDHVDHVVLDEVSRALVVEVLKDVRKDHVFLWTSRVDEVLSKTIRAVVPEARRGLVSFTFVATTTTIVPALHAAVRAVDPLLPDKCTLVSPRAGEIFDEYQAYSDFTLHGEGSEEVEEENEDDELNDVFQNLQYDDSGEEEGEGEGMEGEGTEGGTGEGVRYELDDGYEPFRLPAVDLSSFLYKKKGGLKLREIQGLLIHTLREHGMRRRDMTVELRKEVSRLVDMEVTAGDRGILLTDTTPSIVYACVYRLNASKHVVVKALHFPPSPQHVRLFALLLRLAWGKKRVVSSSTTSGYEKLVAFLREESLEGLFQGAFGAEEQNAFANSCLSGDPIVSLCPH